MRNNNPPVKRFWGGRALLLGVVCAAALLVLVAVPFLEARLETGLAAFLQKDLSYAPVRVEVSLWRRALRVTGLAAPENASRFTGRVEEFSLEGVNLAALVFGTRNALLAERLYVRGLRHDLPHASGGQRGSDTIECGEFEIRGIWGATPGIVALAGGLDDAQARFFTRSLRVRNIFLRGLRVASGKELLSAGAFACRDADVYGCGPALLQSVAMEDKAWKAGLERALWARLRFVSDVPLPGGPEENPGAAGIQAWGLVASNLRLEIAGEAQYRLGLLQAHVLSSLERCVAGLAWFGLGITVTKSSSLYYPEMLEGLSAALRQGPPISGFAALEAAPRGFAAQRSASFAADNSLDIQAGLYAGDLGRAAFVFRGGNGHGEPFIPLPAIAQGWYHLAEASLVVEDTGFSRLWQENAARAGAAGGYSRPEDIRAFAARTLDGALFGQTSAKAEDLRRAIQSFLLQEGRLEISLAPQEPVSLAQLPSILAAGGKNAGIRHTHTPPVSGHSEKHPPNL